jgi:SAM-dependent methyltransferase
MVFHNRTRVSTSIPDRLRREGRRHMIPLYRLLTTSDLAAEAVAGSGSWRFADHIYRNHASGRRLVGRVIDFVLLRVRPARAFRTRYRFTRDGVIRALRAGASGSGAKILSVPCGFPRELLEAAAAETPGPGCTLYGIDLDPEPLAAGRRAAEEAGVSDAFEFLAADAMDASKYPHDLDLIVSTGFGEFLSDDLLGSFLRICRDKLHPAGTLLITATDRHVMSDFLLKEVELHTHYRSAERLRHLLAEAGFSTIEVARDPTGLQAHATATKGAT